MVNTRVDRDGPGPPQDAPPPSRPPGRRIDRRRALPGGRAVVGGLLVGLAATGVLVAWQRAAGTPDRSYAVAARPIVPGEALRPDDVRLVAVDLPDDLAAGAFPAPTAVAGRVALAPIGEGELVQAAQVSEPGGAPPRAEVSFALPRDRAVDGRLASGDLVDVVVTDDAGTAVAAERVPVVALTSGGGGLTSGGEVTVTVGLMDPADRVVIVGAARSGEVTLVRSTHLAPPPVGTEPAEPAPGTPTGGPGDPAGPSGPGPGSAAEAGSGAGTAAEAGDGAAVGPGGDGPAGGPGGAGDASGSGDDASRGRGDTEGAG